MALLKTRSFWLSLVMILLGVGCVVMSSYIAVLEVRAADPPTGTKAWEFQVPTENTNITSNPIVANNRVYFGTDDKKIFCVDALTGLQLWNLETNNAIVTDVAYFDNDINNPDDDIVILGSSDTYIYGLNYSNGSVRWQFKTGSAVHGNPMLYNGKVILGSDDNRVYCLEAATGVKVWDFYTGNWVRSTPAISGNNVLVTSYDYNLYCLDLTTGTKKWQFTTKERIEATPTVYGEYVYFGSKDPKKFYCMKVADGKEVWSIDVDEALTTSPAIYNGCIYINFKIEGVQKIYCMKLDTGERVWEYCYTPTSASTYISISGGCVYVFYQSKLQCLNAFNGDNIWSYSNSGNSSSAPAIAYNRIYFAVKNGTKPSIVCVSAIESKSAEKTWPAFRLNPTHTSANVSSDDPTPPPAPEVKTGEVKWHYAVAGDFCPPAVTTDYVLVCHATTGKLYCFKNSNGNKVWSKSVNVFDGTPCVENDKVYIGKYCLKLSTGDIIWENAAITSGGDYPVKFSDFIYLVSGTKVYCLNAANGTTVWTYDVTIQAYGPACYGGYVVVGYGSAGKKGGVVCLNIANGAVVWRTDTGTDYICYAPSIAEKRVYVGSENFKVYCFDVDTGIKLWDFETLGRAFTTPAVLNKMALFVSLDNKLYCINAETGERLWENRGTGSFNSGEGAWAATMVALANSNVYAGKKHGVRCLKMLSGEEVYSFTVNMQKTGTLYSIGWHTKFNDGVVIADNKIYANASGSVSKITCMYDLTSETTGKWWPMTRQNPRHSATHIDNDPDGTPTPKPTPTPSNGSPTPTVGPGTPTPTPWDGSPTPTVGPGTPTPTPTGGTPKPTPTPTPRTSVTPPTATPTNVWSPTPPLTEPGSQAIQLQTSKPFLSLGELFTLQARVVETGAFEFAHLGQNTDVYMTLACREQGFEYYMGLDRLGNLYFSGNKVPLVREWRIMPMPWVDVLAVQVPEDPIYIGYYTFKAQVVPAGSLPGMFGETVRASVTVVGNDTSSGGQ